MEREIRVILADDHPIFRRGLRLILESDQELKVVFESADGQSALENIRLLLPHVAILDIDMPPPDGLAIATAIRSEDLRVEPVFLTMHDDEELFLKALELGVQGFVVKDGAATEIVDCVKAVASGQSYFSPRLSRHFVSRRSRSETLARNVPSLDDLTAAERNVLRLVAESKTSKEIAESLFISVRTAEHHRANIATKLRLTGRNALIAFAIKHRQDL